MGGCCASKDASPSSHAVHAEISVEGAHNPTPQTVALEGDVLNPFVIPPALTASSPPQTGHTAVSLLSAVAADHDVSPLCRDLGIVEADVEGEHLLPVFIGDLSASAAPNSVHISSQQLSTVPIRPAASGRMSVSTSSSRRHSSNPNSSRSRYGSSSWSSSSPTANALNLLAEPSPRLPQAKVTSREDCPPSIRHPVPEGAGALLPVESQSTLDQLRSIQSFRSVRSTISFGGVQVPTQEPPDASFDPAAPFLRMFPEPADEHEATQQQLWAQLGVDVLARQQANNPDTIPIVSFFNVSTSSCEPVRINLPQLGRTDEPSDALFSPSMSLQGIPPTSSTDQMATLIDRGR